MRCFLDLSAALLESKHLTILRSGRSGLLGHHVHGSYQRMMGARFRNLGKLMRVRLKAGEASTVTFTMAQRRSNDDLDKVLSQEVKTGTKSSRIPDATHTSLLSPGYSERTLKKVQRLMHEAIYMRNTDMPDLTLGQLREEYLRLDTENRRHALIVLATQFGVDRNRLLDLMNHYLTLSADGIESDALEAEGSDSRLAAQYRVERDLRSALLPLSARLFEQLNAQAGGLKFLVDLRADLLAAIKEQNLASLRALDTDLRGMFGTWLGPACLELEQITWNSPAGLLEKIVAYEAVHPISNLCDLKRRLGAGRRCFGYFHAALPGEPLVFIEVALYDKIVGSIQEVLFDENPIDEASATTAMFYSISSTQPGLAGIELGTFLIKRVVRLLQQEMTDIETFVTLSPIPDFMQWLLPKLASQLKDKADSVDKDNILLPSEEKAILEAVGQDVKDQSGSSVLFGLLSSSDHSWSKSPTLTEVLRGPLMRLCARYLLQEKKRGRALDPVTNFHVRNGACVERLNWMGDTSNKGLEASAGLMVNYLYRLEKIEANNQAYVSKGTIDVSPAVQLYLQPSSEP